MISVFLMWIIAIGRLECQSQAVTSEELPQKPKISVRLIPRTVTHVSVDFDTEVINFGTSHVFLITDTKTTDGKKGPYISVDDHEPRTLELRMQLFAPPPYNLYVNGVGAQLRLLGPGEKLTHHFSIPRPVIATEPPYDMTNHGKPIAESVLTKAQLVISVLPATKEIKSLAASKSINSTFTGLETIANGDSTKELYKLQTLICSPPSPISLVNGP